MDDLAAFITARLDEDEAMANEVHKPRDCGCVDRDGEFSPDPVWCGCDYPARVLREVAAKRAMVKEHGPARPEQRRYACASNCTDDRNIIQAAPCTTMRLLAAVWSDHGDYRAEWAPGDLG